MKSAPASMAGCLRPPTHPRSVTRKDLSFQSESVGPRHCQTVVGASTSNRQQKTTQSEKRQRSEQATLQPGGGRNLGRRRQKNLTRLYHREEGVSIHLYDQQATRTPSAGRDRHECTILTTPPSDNQQVLVCNVWATRPTPAKQAEKCAKRTYVSSLLRDPACAAAQISIESAIRPNFQARAYDTLLLEQCRVLCAVHMCSLRTWRR